MTLDKALEIKSRTGEEFLNTDPDEIEEADRLSIEALKSVRTGRRVGPHLDAKLLPGETED